MSCLVSPLLRRKLATHLKSTASHCCVSLTVPAGLLETLIGKAAIGDIEWNRGGRQFKGICWTVPMNYELQVPGSVVPMTILGNANRIDQRVMAVVYSNNYASVGLRCSSPPFEFVCASCAGGRQSTP